LVRFFRRALEVSRIPAGAFQLKAGRRNLLLILLLAARGAFGERLFAHLLQMLFLVPAGRALVFVNRHVRIISLIQNGISSSMSSTLPAGFFAPAGLDAPSAPAVALARSRGSPRGSPAPAREPSICMTSPRISVE